jgi:hypothetical protein
MENMFASMQKCCPLARDARMQVALYVMKETMQEPEMGLGTLLGRLLLGTGRIA